MSSLKTKITAITAIFMALALGIAAFFSLTAISDIGRHDADQALLSLCEHGQQHLDSYFQSIEQSVTTVSAYAETDLDGLEDEKLQAHMDRVHEFFTKLMRNKKGVRTYYYRIDPAVSQTVKGFWYVNDGEGMGQHEVTDITRYDKWDTSKLVWFTVPRATGKPVWLPPYITDNLGARVISYNVPIYYHKEFVGVIGIEIDYSTMANIVDSITLFGSGYAFLNDDEGAVIYHPHMDIITPENQPKVPSGMLSGDKFIQYTFADVEKRAVCLPLENGMRLNVTVPVAEINAGWYKWGTKIITVFAVLLIVFTLLIRTAMKQLIPPHQN